MPTLSEYRERKHWSYSALNQFFNICSLQYAFERVLKLPKAFTSLSLGFGIAYHRVMEWAALERMQGHDPLAYAAADLFQDIWGRQLQEDRDIRFEEGEDAESVAAMGRAMCACAISGTDPEERVLNVSEAFCVPLVLANGETLETPLSVPSTSAVYANGTTRDSKAGGYFSPLKRTSPPTSGPDTARTPSRPAAKNGNPNGQKEHLGHPNCATVLRFSIKLLKEHKHHDRS